jgi:DNA-binding response OmpR family regulator
VARFSRFCTIQTSMSDVKLTNQQVVLCVDDDPAILQLRSLILRQRGYQVLCANNSDDAIAVFISNPVNLVITDHLLPGHSGSDLSRKLKELKPKVPILLISGVSEQIVDLGFADGYLVKGIPIEEFLKLVRDLLEGRSSHSTSAG